MVSWKYLKVIYLFRLNVDFGIIFTPLFREAILLIIENKKGNFYLICKKHIFELAVSESKCYYIYLKISRVCVICSCELRDILWLTWMCFGKLLQFF